MQHLTRRLDATPPQMLRTVTMAFLLRLARPLHTRRLTRLYADVRPGADYVPLTPEELIPKSPEMVARATRVKEEHPERFVTPADAAEMVRKGAALVAQLTLDLCSIPRTACVRVVSIWHVVSIEFLIAPSVHAYRRYSATHPDNIVFALPAAGGIQIESRYRTNECTYWDRLDGYPDNLAHPA